MLTPQRIGHVIPSAVNLPTTAGKGTVLTKDFTTSWALECSPTGDYQTLSLALEPTQNPGGPH